MLRPPWHITDHAAARFMHVRRWDREDEELFLRAKRELVKLAENARYRSTDAQGREMWRCTDSVADAMRWVIAPPQRSRDVPDVVWVGQGLPPERLWDAASATIMCTHLPSTTGSVVELTLTTRPVTTPRHQRNSPNDAWRALVCPKCADLAKDLVRRYLIDRD